MIWIVIGAAMMLFGVGSHDYYMRANYSDTAFLLWVASLICMVAGMASVLRGFYGMG